MIWCVRSFLEICVQLVRILRVYVTDVLSTDAVLKTHSRRRISRAQKGGDKEATNPPPIP